MKKLLLSTLIAVSSLSHANDVKQVCSLEPDRIEINVPDQTLHAGILKPHIIYNMFIYNDVGFDENIEVDYHVCVAGVCNDSTNVFPVPVQGLSIPADYYMNSISMPPGKYPITYQIKISRHGCDLTSTAILKVI